MMSSPDKNPPQRTFKKLRVSLTRSCNFGCVYCAADGKSVVDPQITPVEQFMSWIAELCAVAPIQKIRLTGGEPTLYRDLVQLIAAIKQTTAAQVYLTTNGHRLRKLAGPLKDAGLDGVNVSLDAIEPEVFTAMGGRNYAAVIQGIHDAVDVGLQVKINTTLMAEMNDNQILPLLDFAYSFGTRGLRGNRAMEGVAANHGIVVRFLELMAMGHLHQAAGRRLVTAEQILAEVRSRHSVGVVGRAVSDTTIHYELERGQVFGIIANSSVPFCSDCDRLRLDSAGRVYGCLSNPKGISLSGAGDTAAVLREAMQLKQPQKFTGSALLMREVGG